MTKKILLSIALAFHLLHPALSLAAATSTKVLNVVGRNTIAGYSTSIQITTGLPQEKVMVKIKKPDGNLINLNTLTDSKGRTELEVDELETEKSGKYLVQGYIPRLKLLSKTTDFEVFPGVLSDEKSSVQLDQSVVEANGKDYATLKVSLKDQHGNALDGHGVQVITSKGADRITSMTPGGITDKNGKTTFKISSTRSGISSVQMTDTTSGVTLQKKTKIAFLDTRDYPASAANYLKDAGGDLTTSVFDIAQAAENSSLHHFEISDLPATIQPGQNISFRVTAKTENDETVQNYTGKIHFSAEGENVNVKLPQDYSFTAQDLGTHLFNLSLSFPTAGTYKLVATDLDNTLIKGEKTVSVGSGSGNNQSNSAEKPTVDTPAPGSYSQKNQTIGGTAPSGTTVKVYDNEQEIGSVQADNNGQYSFQTAALEDGEHTVYVTTMEENQTVKATSNTVKFSIDTTPPEVETIILEPSSSLKPNQTVQVSIVSEENLSQSAIVFNTDLIPLNPSLDQPGSYLGSIQTPETPGVYPIDVILVDQLGNEGSYKEKAEVKVDAPTNSSTPPPEEETPTEVPPVENVDSDNNPSAVNGLISYGGDGKVTLVWDAATDNTMVQHYRIYYGTDPSNLTQKVDTKDASTTWYVPTPNGQQRYFAVKAIDNDGNESLELGEIISGTAYTTEVANLPKNETETLNYDYDAIDQLHGSALDSYEVPERLDDTGPALFFLVPLAGIMGAMLKKRKSLER